MKRNSLTSNQRLIVESAINAWIKGKRKLDDLAKKGGMSRQALNACRNNGNKMRLENAILIELGTGIEAEELRPDCEEIIRRYKSLTARDILSFKINNVLIRKIKIPPRVHSLPDNIKSIAASLVKHGQERPIAVTSKNVLLYGEARLRAAHELGWERLECIVIDLDMLLKNRALRKQLAAYTNKIERFQIAKYLQYHWSEFKSVKELEPTLTKEYMDLENQNILLRWNEMCPNLDTNERLVDKLVTYFDLGSRGNFYTLDCLMIKGVPALKDLVEQEQVPMDFVRKILKFEREIQIEILKLGSLSKCNERIKFFTKKVDRARMVNCSETQG